MSVREEGPGLSHPVEGLLDSIRGPQDLRGLSVDELRDSLDFDEPDTDERTNYRSLGGLVMSSLGRVPSVGDVVEWAGLRFEVLDMDGMRVDRIRVRALDADGAGSESDGEHVP